MQTTSSAHSGVCVMSLVPPVGRRNKTRQLQKVLLGATGDLFALFAQQWNNILIDTERRAGLSAIAELLV